MRLERCIMCDICGEVVGINKRYFIIKSKNKYYSSAGGYTDNRTHHICIDCVNKLVTKIRSDKE